MLHSPTIEVLESRLRTLLPEQYQDTYDDVKPTSMGSAGLKYDREGRVAWDEMWQSFCDLAMAGGPPHKGTLLEPAATEEIEAHPNRYRWVTEELSRGIEMVTGLAAFPADDPGWVQVDCTSLAMTGWLTRAITMENISARSEGMALFLPAGPFYRVEKETKNVITSIAKTCHYWLGHTFAQQHRAIGDLFVQMQQESPLLTPAPRPATNPAAPYLAASSPDVGDSRETRTFTHATLKEKTAAAIHQQTGLAPSNHHYSDWLGLACPNVHSAVWMMRMIVAANALSRREATTVFIPLNPATDPAGETATRLITQTHRFAKERNILPIK
ncbi:MAG: hypothetical protein JSS95_09180 [Acidobacteria bacterium]|nr:hypothetical protein [Acidobacteriota bacterium]